MFIYLFKLSNLFMLIYFKILHLHSHSYIFKQTLMLLFPQSYFLPPEHEIGMLNYQILKSSIQLHIF